MFHLCAKTAQLDSSIIAPIAGARVMLVAFTGYGSDEDKLRALAAGFDHHLVKPVDPAKLRRLLLLGREDRPSPLLH